VDGHGSRVWVSATVTTSTAACARCPKASAG
jgi:hypothetical protein